jgi:hypothetical protein
MQVNEQTDLTEKNLARFAEFLNRELERPSLAEQIPEGTHIFHGSYSDTALTQANLKLASKVLLGMTLGYVEEAPLVMVFEYKPEKRAVIDLSTETKSKAQEFIQRFQEQSQQNVISKLDALVAA